MLVAGLRAAQVVLLALCAYLLYATAAPLLSSATPAVRDVRLPEREVQPPERPSLDELAVIWKQSPFGKPKLIVLEKPTPAAKNVAAAASLGWQLMTTAAATPPELSLAGLVNTKDGTRKVVRVGDELAGRTVIQIERRRVILSNKGKLEQLTIGEDTKATTRAARSLRRTQRERAQTLRRARKRPRRPQPEPPAPPEPPRDETPAEAPPPGEIARSIFGGRVELADDEEIVSVNGVPLDDAARLPELAEALAGGAATLRVLAPDGTQRDVSVEAAE